MSMIQSDLLLGQEGGAGYTISRSLRFNSSDSAFLSRTPASAGNRKTWTWAGWVKRSAINPSNGFNETHLFTCVFEPRDSDANYFRLMYNGDRLQASWYNSVVNTAAVFRDQSAWYHVVCAVDLTQATASNRVKLYVNGIEQVKNTDSPPAQNFDQAVNATQAHYIARGPFNVSQIYNHDGYLADIHFIDGQALTPSSFGQTDANGEWQPIAYTGTYGTNGFKLNFADNSAATAAALGKDTSGNGNNWTPNNLSVTAGAGNDSLVDTPSSGSQVDTGLGGQVTGNYATLNPLDRGDITLANGNLDSNRGVYVGSQQVRGTIGVSSGKWYWEVALSTEAGFDDSCIIGIANSLATMATNGSSNFWGYIYAGTKYSNASTSAYAAAFTKGDIIGIAFDADNGSLTFYKNGVSQGTAFTGLASASYFPCSAMNGAKLLHNFGQRPFVYPVSGYKCLCDTSLPAPLTAKPSSAFDVKLYTGNGSTQTISGLGFSPDLVWIKRRSSAISHALLDTVRGTNKVLYSNLTAAEDTYTDTLTAFNSDGFTLGSDATWGGVNASSSTYVAWAFDAGSNTVSNTAGSITSSCRTNQSSGFSIVTYNHGSGVGASTIGHGLNSAPHLILSKYRDGTTNWDVYVRALGPGGRLILNSTGAFTSETDPWNNTNPTSTVFSVGPSSWKGVGNHVAYCFSPVAGYSSMSSFVGNGSSDGPFCFTGFRPRWILLKNATTGGTAYDWFIWDTARSTFNTARETLFANLSSAEAPTYITGIDVLSNGFKLRDASAAWNGNGQTIIYFAVAESPFAYSRAR